MTTLILPFYVERFDDIQGVYGRQIPRLIAEYMQARSQSVERSTWIVPQGEGGAHVAIEAALPRSVVDEEAHAHNATTVLLGRVRVAPEDTYLHIARYRPHLLAAPELIFETQCAMHALPQQIEDAAKRVLELLAGTSSSSENDTDRDGSAHPLTSTLPADDEQSDAAYFAAWRAEILAHDAQELERYAVF